MGFFDGLANFVGGGELGREYADRGLINPQAASFNQGIQNFVNLGQGRPLEGMPTQAYSRAQIQNQELMRYKAQMMEAKKLRQLQMQKAQAEIYKLQNPDPPEFMQKARFYGDSLGLDTTQPGWHQDPRIAEFLKRTGGNTTVNVGPEEGNIWDKSLIEQNVSQYMSLQDAGSEAEARMARLTTMAELNKAMETGGAMGPLITDVKGILSNMGINLPGIDENTTAEEVFSALATQNQFERTALLKGAISEKELKLAGLMDGSLANTQQGREFILEYRMAEAMRAQQLAEAAEMFRVRRESEGERYREYEFKKSDEYSAIKSTPFITRRMLDIAAKWDEEKGTQSFPDYRRSNGVWYTRDQDGEAVPVEFLR